MPRQPKSTPQDDLRRLTMILVVIYLVTVIGMPVVTLLAIGSVTTGVWIAMGLMTVLCIGVWFAYKRQIDAEIKEDAERKSQRKQR